MPKYSANLGFLWQDRDLLDRIDAAAAAGFKAIELHWPYDTPATSVKAACEANGLTLLALNTATGDPSLGEFGLAAVEGREAAFDRSFEEATAYARAAGAAAIHVMGGVIDPARKSESQALLARNLARAAERAPDLTLLLEPLNQRDKPNYVYSTIGEAVSIIEEVGAPNIRVMFDVYHIAISEGDILMRLQRYLPWIGHVQIAAVPSRAEPDEGEIAYGAVFAELERIGYQGWIGCEYRPRAGTGDGLSWMRTLQNAAQ